MNPLCAEFAAMLAFILGPVIIFGLIGEFDYFIENKKQNKTQNRKGKTK